MDVTFYGAVREVTGSMHLLTRKQDRILLDCGMFQGRRQEAERKNRVFPVDPSLLTHLVLSHAHIDHSGRIPVLTRDGFTGRIVCTRATADACRYLLLDSAHIQESDAEYLNYKTTRATLHRAKESHTKKKISKRETKEIRKLLRNSKYEIDSDQIEELMDKYNIRQVRPLYTTEDAETALTFFDSFPYRHPINVGKAMTCKFYDAGHILGSAFSIIAGQERGRMKRILYTGDVGRFDKPILEDPTLEFDEEDRDIDLMIMESTYGDRHHDPVNDLKQSLGKVLTDTVSRGGVLVIPSFAFGRAQELLYVLHQLYDEGKVPKVPVHVDSPLASQLTKVFAEHPEVYDEAAHKTFLQRGKNPFFFKQLHFVGSREDSMALMREAKPHVVISASGMCEAGRILHHLRYRIHDRRNTVLVVGFMAQHTLGRRMIELARKYKESGNQGPAPLLKFFNKEYPLQAEVIELAGFSAHADRDELLRLLRKSNLRIKRIALVHGEEEQTLSFADLLKSQGYKVVVPRAGESIPV